jgi:hypothetical protein
LIPAGISDAGYSITAARELAQREEQQDRRRGMKQNVGQMMAPRLEPVQLAIQHVRDRGERVPVGGVNMGEGPLNIARSDTFDYS